MADTQVAPQQPDPHKWQANTPIDPTTGGDQTETDYQANHDRPDPKNNDLPVEGSRDEVEHSPHGPGTKPDAQTEPIPQLRPDAPTTPAVESDDRIDHQWRAGDEKPTPLD